MPNYECSVCGKKVSKKVADFSKRNYYKILCYDHQPTKEARKLGHELKNKGFFVEFEKNDGFKKIDIAITSARTNIEVDGKYHEKIEEEFKDLKRALNSLKKDFVTIRISNRLINDEKKFNKIIRLLEETLKERKKIIMNKRLLNIVYYTFIALSIILIITFIIKFYLGLYSSLINLFLQGLIFIIATIIFNGMLKD